MLKKWITLGMTALAGLTGSCSASSGQVDVYAGYRRDDISLTRSFESFNNKEKFKSLDIFQIGLEGRAALGYNFYMRANGYWGWILDGIYENSSGFSYGCGSEAEIFSSGFDRTIVDNRYVYGLNAAIGYPFFFCQCSTMLAPVIGYAVDDQSLSLDRRGDYYSSGCCDRKDKTNLRWYGPFVGIDGEYKPFEGCWDLYFNLAYHWGSITTKKFGEECYKDRYKSNRVRGWEFNVGVDYDVACDWIVGLAFNVQNRDAHKKDHFHQYSCSYNRNDNESSSSSSSNGLEGRNKFKWHTWAISMTFGKEF